MTYTGTSGRAALCAHALCSSRMNPGISSRSRWRRALAACALLSAAACRDSSSLPTTGPTHFVLTAAGALVVGSAGSGTACLLTLFRGTAYCWGLNDNGQFGNGSTQNSNVPVPAGGALSFAALGVSANTSCGIENSSLALYCWGLPNDSGQVSVQVAPVLVDGSHKFIALSEGVASGCALTIDRDAYCWGWGAQGQLGDGYHEDAYHDSLPTVVASTPVEVSGGHTFKSLTVGYFTACGLTTQGDAFCWGLNDMGQLGSGFVGGRYLPQIQMNDYGMPIPQLVVGQHHFVSLSVGAFHACGLTQSGEAFCWGHNAYNELGIGTRDDNPHTTPEPVTGNLTFSAIAAGQGFTCALTPRGVAYCWGLNFAGQLGNGITDDSDVPVEVAGGLTFVSIGSSGGFACGIAYNGDVYCWGDNQAGELGNGTTTNSLVPVKTHFTPTP